MLKRLLMPCLYQFWITGVTVCIFILPLSFLCVDLKKNLTEVCKSPTATIKGIGSIWFPWIGPSANATLLLYTYFCNNEKSSDNLVYWEKNGTCSRSNLESKRPQSIEHFLIWRCTNNNFCISCSELEAIWENKWRLQGRWIKQMSELSSTLFAYYMWLMWRS